MEEIVSAVKNADLLLELKAKLVVTKIAVTAVVPLTVTKQIANRFPTIKVAIEAVSKVAAMIGVTMDESKTGAMVAKAKTEAMVAKAKKEAMVLEAKTGAMVDQATEDLAKIPINRKLILLTTRLNTSETTARIMASARKRQRLLLPPAP